MTASMAQQSYRDLNHPLMQDTIRGHLLSTMKLVKLVADFAHKTSIIFETSTHEMIGVAESFRKKSAEYHKSFDSITPASSTLLQAWEALLGAIETDVQKQADFASNLSKSVYNRLLELALYKKTHVNQLFQFRENIDTMTAKSTEMLLKSHDSYRNNYSINNSSGFGKDKIFSECIHAHNEYVLQLKATNELMRQHHDTALPLVLEELEDIQVDVSSALNGALRTFATLTVSKAKDQCSRYERVFSACKQANPQADLMAFVRSLGSSPALTVEFVECSFSPITNHPLAPECLLKCEVIFDKHTESTLKVKRQCLQKEHTELLSYVEHSLDITQSLQSQCQRHMSDHNYMKLYQMQAELSKQRNDVQMATLRLTSVQAQIALLARRSEAHDKSAAEGNPLVDSEVTRSNTVKEMWRKFAFKVRKPAATTAAASNAETVTTAGGSSEGQATEDRSSKRLTINEPKKQRGNEMAAVPHERMDRLVNRSSQSPLLRHSALAGIWNDSIQGSIPEPAASLLATTACPKPKLKGMKSFSLEAPDVPRAIDHSTRTKSNSCTSSSAYLDAHVPGAPASTAQACRKLLMGKEKSLSVDDAEICNDGLKLRDQAAMQRQERYECDRAGDVHVVVRDFKPRKKGDIELRAGQRVQVFNTTDPEWWLGKCNGQAGFFLSEHVMSVYPGQRVFKVEKPLHLNEGGRDVRLTADQIVVEAGKEEHGVITIRTHSSKNHMLLACPLRYLVEL